LESKNLPGVVGCDSLFINNTLTKNGMKELFTKHLVSNPPGFPVTKETNIMLEVEKRGMTFPLFVKVSDSYGSVGLDDSSVCHDEPQLLTKCASLLTEFHNLTVEEFIDGQEFSVSDFSQIKVSKS
jgi:D-alanine-D-alanine ligase-like ATP-grasp enzyme